MESVVSDIVATCLPGFAMMAVAFAASEIGYRTGRRLKDSADEPMRSEIFTIQSSALALIALLIGFSFAIGSAAYENRRQLVLDEAVVIARAYKRAALLPEPSGSEIQTLLVRYVDTRLDLYYQGAGGEETVRSKLREARRLQAAIWDRAAVVARQDPQSIPVGAAMEALGQMDELNARRLLAMERSTPQAILIALTVATAVAMGWVGCGIGLGPRRNLAMSLVLSMLFGFIIAIIIDLDQPRHGIIRASQTALTELRETLRPAP